MEVILSPVPAKNLLNVSSNVEKGELVLMNAFGQVMVKQSINYATTLDVSSLSRGFYFIVMMNSVSLEQKVQTVTLQ